MVTREIEQTPVSTGGRDASAPAEARPKKGTVNRTELLVAIIGAVALVTGTVIGALLQSRDRGRSSPEKGDTISVPIGVLPFPFPSAASPSPGPTSAGPAPDPHGGLLVPSASPFRNAPQQHAPGSTSGDTSPSPSPPPPSPSPLPPPPPLVGTILNPRSGLTTTLSSVTLDGTASPPAEGHQLWVIVNALDQGAQGQGRWYPLGRPVVIDGHWTYQVGIGPSRITRELDFRIMLADCSPEAVQQFDAARANVQEFNFKGMAPVESGVSVLDEVTVRRLPG